jgi:hypothetical protein
LTTASSACCRHIGEGCSPLALVRKTRFDFGSSRRIAWPILAMRVFPTNKDFVKEVKDITQQNLGVVDTDGQDYSQESNSET